MVLDGSPFVKTLKQDRFAQCIPIIREEEGGNDDDPEDPGGRTSRGIIQREYDAYRKLKGATTRDVWTADEEEITDIYRHQYWLPWCPMLPAGVDLLYFDMCVNVGHHEATLLIQRAAHVHDDGHFGLVTLHSCLTANPIILISSVSHEKRVFYRKLRKFWKYGKGWFNRVREIEHDALLMVVAPDPGAPHVETA